MHRGPGDHWALESGSVRLGTRPTLGGTPSHGSLLACAGIETHDRRHHDGALTRRRFGRTNGSQKGFWNVNTSGICPNDGVACASAPHPKFR